MEFWKISNERNIKKVTVLGKRTLSCVAQHNYFSVLIKKNK